MTNNPVVPGSRRGWPTMSRPQPGRIRNRGLVGAGQERTGVVPLLRLELSGGLLGPGRSLRAGLGRIMPRAYVPVLPGAPPSAGRRPPPYPFRRRARVL